MRIPPPPEGFVPVRTPGARGFARAEVADLIIGEVARHGTLHAASRRWEEPVELRGRGRLLAARPPGTGTEAPPGRSDPGERWVVRPYLRGGWMAPLLGDRHLAAGTPRPWTEARAATALERAGVPTAPVLAGLVYPGWPWYRAELVTSFLPATRELSALLFGAERVTLDEGRRALLAAAAGIPEALAAAGVLHRDLNAKNLLIPGGEGGKAPPPPGPYVIDLDRARVGPVSPGETRTMASRLGRSLDKFGERIGPPLTPGERAVLRSPPSADAPPSTSS